MKVLTRIISSISQRNMNMIQFSNFSFVFTDIILILFQSFGLTGLDDTISLMVKRSSTTV